MFNILLEYNFNPKKVIKFFKAYNEIKKTNLFDEEFYKNTYSIKGDALTHYLIKGYKQGFHPSLNFDNNLYLSMYPDIQEFKLNPLMHYVLSGKSENRKIGKVSNISRKAEICRNNLAFLHNFEFEAEPLVSIIILNRNGLNHLKRLFKDFDKNTNYSNYEIIVVDNASSDDSINYLNLLDLPITIIKNRNNQSFSKANNDAVKIANGDFILLLNNDIEPTWGWLNEFVGTIMQDDNIAMVGAKLVFPHYFTGNINKSFKIQHSGDIFAERIKPCCFYAINKSNSHLDLFDTSLNSISESVAVTAAATLIRKDAYLKVGGLDEDYIYGLEDVDLCLKLHKAGYKILYSGATLLFHHESSTRSTSKDYEKNDKHNVKLFTSKWKNYLSKQMLIDKLDNKKFFTEKQLKIAIVGKKSLFLSKVAKDFNNMGYEITLISNPNNYYLGNSTDILLSLDKDFDISKIIAREDILKVLISDNNDIGGYDVLITDNYSDFKNNILQIKLSDNFSNDFVQSIKELVSQEGFKWF